ncbi:hypothetical protein TCON_2042, partial [Astathelohania contejeani]
SDISYANYLKSIAEEITLKDDRLDEYHKKCVNELNIIKEDFNDYFINLRNKLVRDYQILKNNNQLMDNNQFYLSIKHADEHIENYDILSEPKIIEENLENATNKIKKDLHLQFHHKIRVSTTSEDKCVGNDDILSESSIIEKDVKNVSKIKFPNKFQTATTQPKSHNANYATLFFIVLVVLLLFIPICFYIFMK